MGIENTVWFYVSGGRHELEEGERWRDEALGDDDRATIENLAKQAAKYREQQSGLYPNKKDTSAQAYKNLAPSEQLRLQMQCAEQFRKIDSEVKAIEMRVWGLLPKTEEEQARMDAIDDFSKNSL